ncbi:MAG TPA: Asp-tRNA(Asn)/Glu-tRNA(Gln) amidotransferase subunit GatA [Polyangiaceae bacterium]|jgi:aspartyl-tRNA(Asn)/glutamyl-tRNA(Gln) amidotransferase subunit A|nr:Asp-tRNA(Asn)/Glu-tRNA(Gln) amidotransferase subunit GatA [Polyangiaceae bacterium]
MNDVLDLPIAELADRVARGEISAVALTERALARIEAKSKLHAFLHVAREAALASANAVDQQRARGEKLGPLAGVPIAIKDALCTVDAPTTCASKILTRRNAEGSGGSTPEHGWRPPYDATVVARLRAAGAVLVGKTNMDEFAMGSSGENGAFGPMRNPWDPSRTAGGSSGGSAAAVSAGLAAGSLGSDTGGSIRQPAALCGIVGVKPTYGRVSRYGLVAFASSLDQVGPFARDARSAARMLEVIAGVDPYDSTSANVPVGAYEAACGKAIKGLRIGVPEEYFGEGLDPCVARSVRAAIDALEKEGCSVHPVALPHTRHGIATYYIVATAEASSNLARFDGVRFGLRIEPPRSDLQTMYGKTRDSGFGPEVKRRILLGTYVLSSGYYDAYYRKAQKTRTLIKQDFDRAFEKVDAIAAPTSPTPAFKLGDKVDDPLAMYLADIFTLPASLAGIAGLSVPCGMAAATSSEPALPVGLQLLAPAFQEERLFTLASAVERLTAPNGPALPPS